MKKCITVAAILLIALIAGQAWAQSPIKIDVKTVLASKGKDYVDPNGYRDIDNSLSEIDKSFKPKGK